MNRWGLIPLTSLHPRETSWWSAACVVFSSTSADWDSLAQGYKYVPNAFSRYSTANWVPLCPSPAWKAWVWATRDVLSSSAWSMGFSLDGAPHIQASDAAVQMFLLPSWRGRKGEKYANQLLLLNFLILVSDRQLLGILLFCLRLSQPCSPSGFGNWRNIVKACSLNGSWSWPVIWEA